MQIEKWKKSFYLAPICFRKLNEWRTHYFINGMSWYSINETEELFCVGVPISAFVSKTCWRWSSTWNLCSGILESQSSLKLRNPRIAVANDFVCMVGVQNLHTPLLFIWNRIITVLQVTFHALDKYYMHFLFW